ncbi:uncharacterized protein LOC129879809 [Solanum dulcamara]|uniref:uncharacterized protein LOC129879809 n=1 Tax=Solanum dulcamara TaxID=45834 RepID=UPI0024859807|nr:uncharacterized protein LOC129879809 [Solanum dulcamara]
MTSAGIMYSTSTTINSSDNPSGSSSAGSTRPVGAYIASDGFWDSITDERVNEFYLLRGGPSYIIAVVSIYLYFVLSLGPRLMAKRAEPFKLNKLLLLYNMGMTLANLWLFIQGLLVSNYGLDTWGCGKFGGDIRQSPRRGIYLGYLFFLTKLIELLDTVFFVLRKKKEQVTFLHVFHHSIVPIFCWIGIKLAPGGPNGFFPLVNSFIHVIMYSYYALTTFGPRVQPYLWWKKYLTRLQMIQFVLVMINATKTFMSQDCKFPLLFSYLQAAVACAFLVLFAMFYRDAYYKKQSRIAAGKKRQLDAKDANCAALKEEEVTCNKMQPTANGLLEQASCGQSVRRTNGIAKVATNIKTV